MFIFLACEVIQNADLPADGWSFLAVREAHLQTINLPTKKGSLPMNDNEPYQRGRRGSNPQPPDRQSKVVELQTISSKEVAIPAVAGCTRVCTNDEKIMDAVNFDSNLQLVIDLWPNLPDSARLAIAEMVRLTANK